MTTTRSLIDETRPWKFPPADDSRIYPVPLQNTESRGFSDMDAKQERALIRQKREEICPPRTWRQWLMPWTYPKLTHEQKWALKQFD